MGDLSERIRGPLPGGPEVLRGIKGMGVLFINFRVQCKYYLKTLGPNVGCIYKPWGPMYAWFVDLEPEVVKGLKRWDERIWGTVQEIKNWGAV